MNSSLGEIKNVFHFTNLARANWQEALKLYFSPKFEEVLKNADIVDEAETIECPTLLFSSNGKQTSKNWVENQQKFASTMNARLICFDCGHYIHYFKSNEMSQEIAAFVKELER